MVEPQIVVLVVAGSSPVDHPIRKSEIRIRLPNFHLQLANRKRFGTAIAKFRLLMNPTNVDFDQVKASAARSSLWERILNAEELSDCNNLEKLLAGCEIIAVLDGRDLLAA